MKRRRRHRGRRRTGLLGVVLVVAVGFGFVTTQAFTASNTVPATNISQFTQAIGPSQLEPAECISAGITVTSIISGSGTITSTAANQLILGSASNDTLSDTNKGNDCMVGGAGTDSFTGWRFHNDNCVVSAATQSGGTITNCTVVATRP